MASHMRIIQPRITLTTIAVGLGILAAVTAAVGADLIFGGPTSGSSFEFGKWLLQVATVLLGAGLVTSVLRQAEISRTERESWTLLLQDVVTGQDAVETAGLRLRSNPDEAAYTRFIEAAREWNISFRRIMATPSAHEQEEELRQAIKGVRDILKHLIQESEINFLPIARQQVFDDALLETKIKKLAEKVALAPGIEYLPEPLTMSTGVSELLLSKERFPELAALLQGFNGGKFKEDCEIDRLYHVVKDQLERNAGVRRRSQTISA